MTFAQVVAPTCLLALCILAIPAVMALWLDKKFVSAALVVSITLVMLWVLFEGIRT